MAEDQSDSKTPVSFQGRIANFLFGILIIGICSGSILGVSKPAWESWFWKEVPCRILESYIMEKTDSDKGIYFYPVVRFSFLFEGKNYERTGFSKCNPIIYDYSEAQRIIDKWSSGKNGTCFVNPKELPNAVLDLSVNSIVTVFLGLSLFLSLFGFHALYKALFGMTDDRPWIASPTDSGPSRKPGIFVFQAFAAIIVVLALYAETVIIRELFVHPIMEAKSRDKWVPVPCQVEWRQVRESNDSETGATYFPNILYRYQISGKTYKSNNFGDVSSTRYDYLKSIVLQYPPGLKTTCYVDPDEPYKSVLKKEIHPDLPAMVVKTALMSLFPGFLIFLGFGLFRHSNSGPGNLKVFSPADGSVEPVLRERITGLTGRDWPVSNIDSPTSRSSTKIIAPSELGLPSAAPSCGISGSGILAETPESDEVRCLDYPETFVEKHGPRIMSLPEDAVGKVGCLFLLTLIWCGPLFAAILEKKSAHDYGPIITLFPFLGVGIILAGALIYSFLALFNPSVEIVVEKWDYVPGEVIFMTWRLKGRKRAVKSLTIRLEGVEKATYSRGTSDFTETSVFFNTTVYSTIDPANVYSGKADIEIPKGAMHSFCAPKNKVEWKIKIEGEIPLWPDVGVEFPVNILPKK